MISAESGENPEFGGVNRMDSRELPRIIAGRFSSHDCAEKPSAALRDRLFSRRFIGQMRLHSTERADEFFQLGL